MTAIVGIDPGLTGAIAMLRDDLIGGLVIFDMPVIDKQIDPYELGRILCDLGPVDLVAVESQQAFPRQGGSSSFKTGVGYGVLIGQLALLERPVIHVTPAKWTRALAVGADKGTHRRRALDQWPAHSDLFRRVKDDGRADAALIAWWAMNQRVRNAA